MNLLQQKTVLKKANNAFFRTAFCLSAILSKRVFPADKHILRYVFVVLNRLDDGLFVTLLMKKVVATQPLFLIDRPLEIQIPYLPKICN